MILIDKQKITYDELKNLLKNHGFLRTTSRRFRRFEKTLKDNAHYGVEIEDYYKFYEVNYYYTWYLDKTGFNALFDDLKQYEFRG